MLEKFIVHIKNIIFLKLIIYFLIIGFLLWLIPIFNEDYSVVLERKEKAEKSFSEAAVKLYSIIESESKILDTYKSYEGIINTPPEHICNLKNTVIIQVQDLAARNNIRITNIKFLQIFKNFEPNRSSDIKIRNYDVNTSFTAPTLMKFQDAIKQIYKLMPANSIITEAEIRNAEYLDPQLVLALSNDQQPDLLKAQFNVRIRELSVK